MIRVRLKVVPAAAELDDDNGVDWGEWAFTSLPRTGDHIDLLPEDQRYTLQVRRVVHFAAQHPLPRTEMPYLQRKEPSICIIAAEVV